MGVSWGTPRCFKRSPRRLTGYQSHFKGLQGLFRSVSWGLWGFSECKGLFKGSHKCWFSVAFEGVSELFHGASGGFVGSH